MKKKLQQTVARCLAIIICILAIGSDQTMLNTKAEGTKYAVNISANEHGGFMVYKDSYEEGDGVTFVISPESGYATESYTVTNDTTGDTLDTTVIGTGYIFTMPASSVTISAVFREKGTGTIQVVSGEGGSVTITAVSGNNVIGVTDTTQLMEGDKVTITPSPDAGYICTKVAYTCDGVETEVMQEGSGNYYFLMPHANTQVEVVFVDAVSSTGHEYTITTPPDSHFRVTASQQRAMAGERIILTIETLQAGYTPSLEVLKNDTIAIPLKKNSETQYQFYMPDANVSVSLTETENMAGDPTDGGDLEDIKWDESTTSKEGEPDILLGKAARWTDIERGYAEIVLKEKDTSDWSYSPCDYIIVIDRSDSVTLSRAYNDIYTGSEPQAPCMNKNHCYLIKGQMFFLMDWYWGKNALTGQIINLRTTYPYSEIYTSNAYACPYLWNYHYDYTIGAHLGTIAYTDRLGNVNYIPLKTQGCYSRIECEKNIAKQALDYIQAYDTAERNKIATQYGSAALANVAESRVAFWAFSGGNNDWTSASHLGTTPGIITVDEGFGSGLYNYDFSNAGISQYIGFTPISQKSSVIAKIEAVGAGGGTEYGPSFHLAYDLIRQKETTNDRYNGVATKFIFLTDGADQQVYGEVSEYDAQPNINASIATPYAEAIKHSTKGQHYIFGVGVGMFKSSNFMKYLKDTLSSVITLKDGTTKTTCYTAGINMEADLVAAIQDATLCTTEVKAVNKKLTDTMSEYFEVVDIANCDGTANVATDKKSIQWTIPEGEGKEYTCTVRVKLKDEYRFLISDTSYPTNLDIDATVKGAKLDYGIQGGAFNTQTRTEYKESPVLKYGTTTFSGIKHWTVEGSEPSSLTLQLSRQTATSSPVLVSSAVVKKTVNNPYSYKMEYRYDLSGEKFPIVTYNNKGEPYTFSMKEQLEGYTMRKITKAQLETDDYTVTGGINQIWDLFNEPNRAQVTLDKIDSFTGEELKDAVFTVYEYTGNGDTDNLSSYQEYKCTQNEAKKKAGEDYWATLSSNNVVTVRYDETAKKYQATNFLYRTPKNQGYFKIVETTTPKNHVGDWKSSVTPTETSTYLDKNSYNVIVPATETDVEYKIANNTQTGKFENDPLIARIKMIKTGEVPKTTVKSDGSIDTLTYEEKGLPGAWYLIRAKEDVYSTTGALVYQKGDFIKPITKTIYGPAVSGNAVQDTSTVTEDNEYFVKINSLNLSKYKEDESKNDRHISFVGSATISGNTVSTNSVADATLDIDKGIITFDDGKTVDSVYVTDSKGEAYAYDLPLGTYEVLEMKAPTGYTRDMEASIVEVAFTYNDTKDYQSVIEREASFFNSRQKVDITPNNPDPKKGDNNPTIQVVKNANKEFYKPGEEVTYTVTVKNTGDCDLTDVSINDVMGGDLKTEKSVGTIAALAKGESQTVTYTFKIPTDAKTGTTYKNVVTATGKSKEDTIYHIAPKTVSDLDEEKVMVIDNGIGVLKQADKKTYQSGETITYDVDVINANGSSGKYVTVSGNSYDANTLFNVDVTDQFTSAGVDTKDMKFLSSGLSNRWKESNGHIYITYLLPGEIANLKYDYKIPENFTQKSIVNKVTVKSGSKTAEDIEIVYVKDPSIQVTKVAEKHSYKAGETVDYTITVKNNGNCALKDVELTDALLEGVFKDNISDAKGTESKIIGDLAINESKQVHFYYQVKDTDIGSEIDNIIIARGHSIAETPDEKQIWVQDKDTETVNTQLRVGVRKLGYQGGIEVGVEGAEFSLYARKDITDIFGTVVIAKDTLIETTLTDADGYANFKTDIPIGEYYVKEINAPAGYYDTNAIVYIDADNYKDNDQVAVIYRGGRIVNAASKVTVFLKDDSTMNELAAASLAVLDANKNEVRAWITSNTNGTGYEIYGLVPGVEYTLVEKQARIGYVNKIIRCMADSELNAKFGESQVTFTIPDASTTSNVSENSIEFGKIDKDTIPKDYRITITNDIVIGEVRINKQGEYLDSWNTFDKITHYVQSAFAYLFGGLKDVEFQIYANEDIVHPDGATGIIFHKGDLIKTGVTSIAKDAIGTTDSTGMVTFTGLYLGEYSIKETKGVDGYKIIEEPVNFSLAAIDDKTPIVQASKDGITIINYRQKVNINAMKASEVTNEALAGAEFTLYNKEDIKNVKGTVITPKNTPLETSVTDSKGLTTFSSDLPLGTYYVKETKAPNGYLINNNLFEVNVAKGNTSNTVFNTSVTIKDPPADGDLEVDKSAPSTTYPGATIKYVIEKVRNNNKVDAKNFILTDELPANTTIDTLYTGTYNTAGKENVYYKTNLSKDLKVWKTDLSMSTNTKLSVSDLKLKDNEYITSFVIDYGTVKSGFSEVEKPYYFVKIGATAKRGSEFINNIRVNAYVNGQPVEVSDTTKTVIPNSAPKTGDESNMFLWILLILVSTVTPIVYFNRNKLKNLFKKKEKKIKTISTAPLGEIIQQMNEKK